MTAAKIKRSGRVVTSFLLILMVMTLTGCQTIFGPPVKTPEVAPPKVEKKQYSYIDLGEVEWVTMQGGLHITTKVLFPANAKDKISRIVDLINKGTGKKAATKEEINGLHSKARPINIDLKMKNGTEVFIQPSYKITSWKNGWSASPRNDRFVLNTMEKGKDMYYTVFSKDVAKFANIRR